MYSVPSFPSGQPEILKGTDIGSTKQVVLPGDVLICKINPRINRVWRVGPSRKIRQIASSEWIIFRNPFLNSIFLQRYFSSPKFRELITTDLTGVGGSLTRAQPKRVETFPILIPPIKEQKQIADKLDTLLARLDACREHLERVPGILKRFRQAVLAKAVSGKLSEVGHTNEGWKYVDIQSVANVGTGSTPLRSNPQFYSVSGTPWITSAATGEAFIYKAQEFVTEKGIKAHRLKLYPVGTLIVAMYGEGKTRGQVSELAIEATINQACAAIIVDEEVAEKGYVKLALQANYLEMRELAEGGNQPNLNLNKIKEFKFLLPPRSLQQEIILEV